MNDVRPVRKSPVVASRRLATMRRGGWPLWALAWATTSVAVRGESYVDPFASAPSAVRGVAEGSPVQRDRHPAGAVAPAAAPAEMFAAPPPFATQPAAAVPAAEPAMSTVPAQPIAGGEILARIDGEVILSSDVLWQVNQLLAANRDRIPEGEIETVRQMLIRQQVMGLIDTKLLYADFRRKIPPENLPKIQESLAEPFEEVEIPRLMELLEVDSRGELDALLKERGASLSEVKRQFVEKTIAGEWLRQLTPKMKPITHEQMLEYYREREHEYQYEARVKYEELMVRFDRFPDRAAAWSALAAMGNRVWRQASSVPGVRGAVFADVARESSHGFTAADGGVHEITLGSLQCAALNAALAELAVGQMSDGTESPLGFHIVRVLERTPAGQRPFTEVQAEIRAQLEQQQRQQSVQAEVERLRRHARVWTQFDGDLQGARLSELLDGSRRR